MILLSLIACAAMIPPDAAMPPPAPQPVQDPGPPPTPGSLWSEVAARQLIGMDGNARRVGDLITVKISDSSTTSLDAGTQTARKTSTDFHVDALLGLDTSIIRDNPNLGGEIKLGGGSDTSLDGTGTTSRNGTLVATVTCSVVAVLPNGNLLIEGRKAIKVNRETQYLALRGVVRPRDILLDNTVRSDLIADADIEFTGAGVIAKDQGGAWGSTIATAISPF